MSHYKLKLCYLVFCLFLFTIQGIFSQVGTSEDKLAQGDYDDMVGHIAPMSLADGISKVLFDSIVEVINREHSALTTMSNDFLLLEPLLIDYTDNVAKGYVYIFYPRITVPGSGYGNGNSLGNIVIRKRFVDKLNVERANLIDYVDPLNPISEGDRLLLILGAIETIVQKTLENTEPQKAEEP